MEWESNMNRSEMVKVKTPNQTFSKISYEAKLLIDIHGHSLGHLQGHVELHHPFPSLVSFCLEKAFW
jgi:hypothetical protein